jgi:chromosome segregation ATPase
VGDFAENLVSQMIEAFKNGEDYMEKFEESFDDMIDNMIMKAIVSRVIGDRIKQIFDYLDSQIKSDSQGLYDEKAELEQERERLKESFESLEKNPVTKEMFGEIIRMYKDKLSDLDNRIEEINRQINEAGSQSITPELTEDVRDMVSGMKDNVREEFLALMDAFGITYGQSSSGKDLSQLQQGIQSVSETTANALESYMNGVSQQVYLHSELLTQIRDAVMGTDSDIQLGVQGQMLLQLQQSYQVQMSIQGILEGVLVPSGRAFAVELMS